MIAFSDISTQLEKYLPKINKDRMKNFMEWFTPPQKPYRGGRDQLWRHIPGK